MLFIVKYDACCHLLINGNYMPFKCGIDICFNKQHVRANLNNGMVNYVNGTEVFKDYVMYQVKHFFKEEVKIGKNILWVSPYATECDCDILAVEEELIC